MRCDEISAIRAFFDGDNAGLLVGRGMMRDKSGKFMRLNNNKCLESLRTVTHHRLN